MFFLVAPPYICQIECNRYILFALYFYNFTTAYSVCSTQYFWLFYNVRRSETNTDCAVGDCAQASDDDTTAAHKGATTPVLSPPHHPWHLRPDRRWQPPEWVGSSTADRRRFCAPAGQRDPRLCARAQQPSAQRRRPSHSLHWRPHPDLWRKTEPRYSVTW